MALYVCRSSAFLLSSECQAPSPCTCSGSSGSYFFIQCSLNNLKAIPQFVRYNTTVKSLTVHLQRNCLTTIPNNVFANLSSMNTSIVELYIGHNNISIIGNDAFIGVENMTLLYLDSNNLTTIPFAISKLTHLQELNIIGNPLCTIDPSVMPNIGGSLQTFQLDLAGFTEWPAEFNYLRTLKTLIVNYIPFSHLDINAFRGFENTLTSLAVMYAKLDKVPRAICRLTYLDQLVFENNLNLKENRSSIFEPCGHMLSLSGLYLDNNALHNFPDVISMCPYLTSLNADNNKFQYIESAVIPPNSKLDTIVLSNNLFERIPYALNKLPILRTINIQYNKIRTVESADLEGLLNLVTLYLNNNPLAYIDPDAFNHNPYLHNLLLQYTQINHVPQAVVGLSNLETLNLKGNPIDCTCEMSYLKNWNVSAVTYFQTQCAYSTETIKTFVTTSLQLCPDA